MASINKQNVPEFAERLLRRMAPYNERHSVVDDFEETFHEIKQSDGILKARFWYWMHVLKTVPAFLQFIIRWRAVMFGNHIKVTLRNIQKHKGFSLINIVGLALGMACSILILLWVQDECRFDGFHEHADELCIVGTHSFYGSDVHTTSGTPPALGPALKVEYPEILNTARFVNGPVNMVISYRDRRFNEQVEAADPSVLEMFTFPMIVGNPISVLSQPHSIVLTERMAEKYFGRQDPIGEILTVDHAYDLVVTGILENIPNQSSIRFDFLVPIEFFREYWDLDLEKWTNFAYTTYVQLGKSASVDDVNRKIANRIRAENAQYETDLFLAKFDRLHLYGLGYGGGNNAQVWMFGLIALFVLLIACINFMNLTTACSGNRAKEIGMRKVTGANRRDIAQQFYSESIVMAFLSFIGAVIIVILFLPVFNDLCGKELNPLDDVTIVLGMMGVMLFTGLVAGSYPALFMSSFRPDRILKGELGRRSRRSFMRKCLVVVQFAISTGLIIMTVVVSRQLRYVHDKDLGYDKENILVVPMDGTLKQHPDAVKKALLQHPGILHVSAVSWTPVGVYSSDNGFDWDGRNPSTNPSVRRLCTDTDFLKTFGIEMVLGEFFSNERITEPSDVSGKVIINETFARIMGSENPIGRRLSRGSTHFMVTGVMKDFHFSSLYRKVGPLAVYFQRESAGGGSNRFRFMCIKVLPENLSRTIEHVKEIYEQFNPWRPFTYRFLEDDYSRLYRSDRRTGLIIRYFTIAAVFISFMGLFGMASYLTAQRTKEIGIRKVLGASVPGITILLSKEFIKWVLIANVIAWPAAYIAMRTWLQNFAYRIDITPWPFIVSACSALVVAILTVSYQSIRAALAHPVESLRYE